MTADTWRDVPELVDRTALVKLMKKYMTIADIAAALQCSPRSVETAIERHNMQGYIRMMRERRKRWGV